MSSQAIGFGGAASQDLEDDLIAAGQRALAEAVQKVSTDDANTTKSFLDQIVDNTISQRADELRFMQGEFSFKQRMAKMYVTSGLFGDPSKMSPEQAIAQAVVKIDLGRSMGFTPAESLKDLYVINGVLAIAAALRAARMQAAGWSWTIDWLTANRECVGCRVWLFLNGKPFMRFVTDDNGNRVKDPETGEFLQEQVSESYTKADAEKMLTTIYEDNPQYPGDYKKRIKKRVSILQKDNWKMNPRNMYYARCITNAQRFYAPGVLNVNILSAEEAADIDTGGVQAADLAKAARYAPPASPAISSVIEEIQNKKAEKKAESVTNEVPAPKPAPASAASTQQPAPAPAKANGHSQSQQSLVADDDDFGSTPRTKGKEAR